MAKVGEDHRGFIFWKLNQLLLEIGQGLTGKRLGGLALGIKLGPKADEDNTAFFKGVAQAAVLFFNQLIMVLEKARPPSS